MDDDPIENIRKHFDKERFIHALDRWGSATNTWRNEKMADEEYQLEPWDEEELDLQVKKVQAWQQKKSHRPGQRRRERFSPMS
jgi:hypothetical protein